MATKTIRVFGNGAPELPQKLVLDEAGGRDFALLLSTLTQRLELPGGGGVRKLYSIPDLKLVKTFSQLFSLPNSDFVAVGERALDKARLPTIKTKRKKKVGGRYVESGTAGGILAPLSDESGQRRDGGDGNFLPRKVAVPPIKKTQMRQEKERAREVLRGTEAADTQFDAERDRQKRAHQQRMLLRQKQRQHNQERKMDHYADQVELFQTKVQDERTRQKQELSRKLQARERSARAKRGGFTPTEAATVIQSQYRGYRTRKGIKQGSKQIGASTPDVAAEPQKKNNITRNREVKPGAYGDLLAVDRIPTPDLSFSADELYQLQSSAATNIQRHVRGYQTRKKHPVPLRQARLERERKIAIAKMEQKRAEAAAVQSSAMVNQAEAATATSGPVNAVQSSRRQSKSKEKKSKGDKESKAARREQKAKKKAAKKKSAAASSKVTEATTLERQTSRFSLRGVEEKSTVEKTYDIGKMIGDGNFAVVRECTHRPTGRKFALKIVDKSKTRRAKESQMIANEIETMRSLRHDNCMALHDVIDTNDELYLVLELVAGGDLFDRVVSRGKYPEAAAAVIVKAMAIAINHMHSKSIIHRDLKPENLLVCPDMNGDDTIKLADFGLSMVVKEPLTTVCGTPTYVAPEILSAGDESSDAKDKGYGLPVDMWAIGIISYIILCGFPPFASSTKSQKDLFRKIREGKFTFPSPYWDEISGAAKDLIRGLLVVDPQKRLTAVQVLSHPWITAVPTQGGEPQQKVGR